MELRHALPTGISKWQPWNMPLHNISVRHLPPAHYFPSSYEVAKLPKRLQIQKYCFNKQKCHICSWPVSSWYTWLTSPGCKDLHLGWGEGKEVFWGQLYPKYQGDAKVTPSDLGSWKALRKVEVFSHWLLIIITSTQEQEVRKFRPTLLHTQMQSKHRSWSRGISRIVCPSTWTSTNSPTCSRGTLLESQPEKTAQSSNLSWDALV